LDINFIKIKQTKMGKYIRRFESLNAATMAEDLVSPHLSNVEEND